MITPLHCVQDDKTEFTTRCPLLINEEESKKNDKPLQPEGVAPQLPAFQRDENVKYKQYFNMLLIS